MSPDPVVITRRLGTCTIYEELRLSPEGDLLFRCDIVDAEDPTAEEWSILCIAAEHVAAAATAPRVVLRPSRDGRNAVGSDWSNCCTG